MVQVVKKVKEVVVETGSDPIDLNAPKVTTPLWIKDDDRELHDIVIGKLSFLSNRDKTRDSRESGSYFVYSVLDPITPIGLIPVAHMHDLANREGYLSAMNYIRGTRCKVQFAEVGEVLGNGTAVTEADKHITFFAVESFPATMKAIATNLTNGIGVAVPADPYEV